MTIHVPHFVLLFATVLNVSLVQRYVEMLSVQLEQSLHCVLLWHTDEALARKGKSMRSHPEPFSCKKERERSDRDNWDLNDVSTRNLNWMSKWHCYLRLSCGKCLFFSGKQSSKQLGVDFIWSGQCEIWNVICYLWCRADQTTACMHASLSRPFSHSLGLLLVHSNYHTVVLSEIWGEHTGERGETILKQWEPQGGVMILLLYHSTGCMCIAFWLAVLLCHPSSGSPQPAAFWVRHSTALPESFIAWSSMCMKVRYFFMISSTRVCPVTIELSSAPFSVFTCGYKCHRAHFKNVCLHQQRLNISSVMKLKHGKQHIYNFCFQPLGMFIPLSCLLTGPGLYSKQTSPEHNLNAEHLAFSNCWCAAVHCCHQKLLVSKLQDV